MKQKLLFVFGKSTNQAIWSVLVLLLLVLTGEFGMARTLPDAPLLASKKTPVLKRGLVPATLPPSARIGSRVARSTRSALGAQPTVTALTQTSCGQSFNVLSSFTATDGTARPVGASSVSVRNQPANGRVQVNNDGTFNFTPTGTTSGTSTFTLTALPTSASYVTTSGLTVDNNLTCEPFVTNLCPIASGNNITSSDLTDFATLTQSTIAGVTTIKAVLSGTATAGDRAGFVISSDAFLSASLLQTYTINTYLGTSSTVRNTKSFTSLLDIQLLSGNLGEISIPTTQSFDRVELVVSSLVSLATTNIYYGFSRPAPIDQVVTVSFPANICTDILSQTSCAQSFAILANDIPLGSGVLDPASVTIPVQPGNGVVSVNPDGTIRFTPNTVSAGTATFSYSVCTTTGPSPTTLVTTAGTSASGIVGICALCSISGSENVGDGNLTNAATISIPVGVAGFGLVRARLNGVARAGDIAGFIVGNSNVLTVSLLNSFTVTTYRNGEVVEQGNGGSLLNLQLLSGGQYEISFQSSHDFDEVEFRAGALATLLNTTQVYYGFSRFAQTCNSFNAQINFGANVCPPFTFACASATVTGTFIANNTAGQSGTLTIPFTTPITASQNGAVTFSVSGADFAAVPGPFTTTLTAGQTTVDIPITYAGTGAIGVRTLSISSPLATSSCSTTVTVNAIPTTPTLLVLTPVNSSTVSTSPTFSGTATPGSIITVLGINGLLPSVGGVVIANLITGAFSTNLLTPLAPGGPQNFTVVAVNPLNAGLISTAPVTVTVVNTASPTLTVLTPVNNSTVTTTPTFSGTATPGSLVTVLGLNGLLTPGVGITADLVSGTFSTGLLLPLSPGGPQSFTVVAVNLFDPAHLLATVPVTVTVVNTASPTLSVLTPVNNSTVTTTPTFSGTATPGSLITVLGLNGLLTPGVGITADLVSGTFSTGLLLPLSPGGPQSFTVVAVNLFDPAHLLATVPVTVTVVNTASPTLSVLTPVNNSTVTTTPTFSGTATPGSLITVLGLNGLLTPGVGITADLLSGTFSTGLLLPLTPGGPQTFTVVAVNLFDPAHLITTVPVTVTVVNTASPTLTVLTPVNNSTVTTTPTFSGTATPGSLVTVLGLNGLLTPGVGITADLVSGTFSTGLLLPLSPGGPQTFTVVAVNLFDPTHLIATVPVTVTVVNTASPTLTVLTPVNNSTVTTTPTFSGTATPGSLITVLGLNGLLTPGVGITADLVSGTFSTGLLLPLSPGGPQSFTVVAVNLFDPAHLIATVPVTVTVVNTASPTLLVVSPVNNTTVTTTPTFSGTATPGSLVTVLGVNGLLTPGVGITADLVSGMFTTGLLLPLSPGGPQTFTVVAVNLFDPAHLIATVPVTVTVVNTASPTLSVLTPVNNSTVTTTPTFSGTATPGSLITVLGLNGLLTPGVGITADLLSGTFTTGLLLPLTPGGPQTFTVVAVNVFDPAHLLATVPVTVTVVNTASPTLTVLTPVNNSTVTTTPTFSGTATPGSLITVLGLNGLLTPGVGITADLLSGTFSTGLLLPLSPGGPQTFTVVAVNLFDPAHLIATVPVTVTVVNTASPTLTVLTPVNNSTVTTTPTFSGTATPGSLITVLGLNGLLTPGVGITADLLSGTFTTGLLLPLTPGGPQTFTVVAVNLFDPAHLIATVPVTVTVVNTASPTLTVLTPVNNSTVTTTPTFSGTATPGSLITVLGLNGLLTPGVGITADLVSGTFTTGLVLPLSPGGPQTFTVVAVNLFDPAHLLATVPVTVTVVNTASPTLTVLTPVNNSTVTTTPTFSGTATPGSLITVLGLNGLLTPGVGITADLVSGTFSTSLLLPLTPGGPQTFTVVAVNLFDPAHLLATVPVTVTVVNTASPTLTVLTPVNNSTVTTTPTFNGTATPGSLITVLGVNGLLTPGVGITADLVSGTFSTGLLLPLTPGGPQTFTVVAVNLFDPAHLLATVPVTVTVVNTASPTLTVLTPVNNSTVTTSPTFSGTATPGSLITVLGLNGLLTPGVGITADLLSGTFSTGLLLPLTPGGPQTFTVVAVNLFDPAHLLATVPVTVTVVNTASPTLFVVSPVNNSTVTTTPTFSGTATPGSLITVLGLNGLLTPGVGITADLLSGTFSTGLLLPLSPGGPQTFTVVAVNVFDPAHLITTVPVTVTVVNTASPTLFVVSPVNNSTVTTTPTFSGTATPGSLITVLGLNGLLTPGVGITADLLSGTFTTGLLLPLSPGGPQTFTVVAVNLFDPAHLLATVPVTVTVVNTASPTLFVVSPVNNSTVTTTPTFSGTATPGSLITVLGLNGLLTPGVGITADLLSGTFSTGLLLPLSPGGPQTFTVVAVNVFDPAHLITTVPVTVTVVNTASPTLFVVSPVNNSTVTTTPTFSGTATPGSLITVLGLNGLLTPGVGITADLLSGTFSTGLLLPLSPGGPQSFTVVAVNLFDPAHLIATVPVTVTVVNTASPTLAVITPANNTTVTTTPTFSGTATPGSLITVLGLNGLLTPGVGITADLLSGTFSTGLLLPLSPGGPQTFTVVAVNVFDPAHLITTVPVTVTVVNTASPTLFVVSPVNNSTVTTTPTFSGTATPGSLITVLGLNGLLTPGVGITADLLSGTFTTGLLLPLSPGGPQTFTVVAVNLFDPAHLLATVPVTVTVVNTASPTLFVVSPVNNSTVTTTPTFSGTATPGSLITVLGLNGLLTPGVGITADLLSGTFSTGLLLPLSPGGPQTFTVVAVNVFDPAHLITTVPVTVTVVNTASPTLTVLTPVNNSTVTTSPTFSGTATPGSLITVLGLNGLLTPGVGITADLLSGTFSTGLLLPLSPGGPQTFTVVAVNLFDPTHLITTVPVTVTVVNTASPTLTVLTPVNNSTVTTSPTFSGTATPGSLITVLGLNGLLTPGVGITADLLSGTFSTGLLLPLTPGGPQTFTVVAVNLFDPAHLIATVPVTVTVVGSTTSLFTFNCGTATVTGLFTANGVGGQAGTLNIPILNALAGPVSLTISGTNFGALAIPVATTLTVGQTSISIPLLYNGSGLAGFQTISITSDQGTTCSVSVPILGPVGSLTLTQTACAESFSVLSSFTAVGSGALDPATVQVVTQPATGTVRVNADGTINFQPTSSSAGTATFTIEAASTITNVATQQFVTTSDLTVSNNLTCQPVINLCPITDQSNITSPSLADFAHLEQTTLLGVTTIKAALNGTGQAGDLAGFIIANPTLLSAAVLPTYTINTYLGSSPTVRDSKTFSSLLDIQLLSGGLQELSFQTTQSFDHVELVVATAASVLLSNDIYYGFSKPATVYEQKIVTINFGADICTDVVSQTTCAQSFSVLANDIAPGSGILDPTTVSIATQPANGTVTVNADGTLTFTPSTPASGTAVFSYSVCTKANPAAVANTATNGTAVSGISGICLLCSVTSETAVSDANLTNFATISIPVGVAGSGFVRAKLNQMAPAGDYAGFVIGNANILAVGFLNSVTISTYKGGVLQEQVTGGSLLTLQLLSGTKYEVKFQTTKEFDEIQFNAGALASVLSNTQVYYGFADFGQVCGSHNVRIVFPANICTAPPTVAILDPVNSSTVTTTPTVSGTATPGSTVVISTPGNATACQVVASPAGLYACAISLPVGVQSITAVATNANGVSTPATVTVTVLGPPTIVILSPPNNGTVTTILTVSGTATPGSTVVISTPGNATACQTTASASGTYVCGITLPTGPQCITAVATNSVGVSVPAISCVTVLGPPTIVILSPPNNSTVTTTPTISGTATPGSTVVISTVGNATACQTTASASGTYSCGITLPIGVQSVTAVATNSGGTSTPATVTVTVLGPPTIVILSPPNNTTVTPTPTVSGTATPGSTVVISTPGNATACQTTASASGTYACGITLSVGPQSITAVATNAGGTSSPAVVSVTVVAPTSGSYLVNVKVLLQGPLLSVTSGTLMNDNIRANGYLPTTTPYSVTLSARFTQVGGGGGETTTPAVLSANAGTADAIVDWVLVELRDPANSGSIVATRSGLVQRDGDVVRPDDGTSPLSFTGLSSSQYYVSVKHRNHLGVMTANLVSLSVTGTIVDFTSMSNAQVYDKPSTVSYDGVEMVTVNGKRALWAGDANADGKVKYIGLASDNTVILNNVINAQGANPNPTYNYDFALGYFAGDLDMNGKAKYQGASNDPTVIFNNVVATYPLNTLHLYNYDFFIEQLP